MMRKLSGICEKGGLVKNAVEELFNIPFIENIANTGNKKRFITIIRGKANIQKALECFADNSHVFLFGSDNNELGSTFSLLRANHAHAIKAYNSKQKTISYIDPYNGETEFNEPLSFIIDRIAELYMIKIK